VKMRNIYVLTMIMDVMGKKKTAIVGEDMNLVPIKGIRCLRIGSPVRI
jgi:hypothetical protein